MSPRPRVYKTEAIVLRTMELGEADRVLSVLTPRLGKLRVIAKGVRRPRSRIGGGLEPFSDVQLVLAVGRTFDVVTSSSLEDPHLGLRNDLHSTAAAWYVVELTDRFCEGAADSHEAFRLLPRCSPRSTPAMRSPARSSRAGSSSTCSRRWDSVRSSRVPGVRRPDRAGGERLLGRRRRGRLSVMRARGARRPARVRRRH